MPPELALPTLFVSVPELLDSFTDPLDPEDVESSGLGDDDPPKLDVDLSPDPKLFELDDELEPSWSNIFPDPADEEPHTDVPILEPSEILDSEFEKLPAA